MYRPTVRYDDVFKTYVDDLFHATHLDRNQIIRAALFAAAHTREFYDLLRPYLRGDVPTPLPLWRLNQDGYWLEQCPQIKAGGKDVNAITRGATEVKTDYGVNGSRVCGEGREDQQYRCIEPIARREGAIPIRTEGGGIKIRIG